MNINNRSVIGFVGLGVMGGPMCRNIAHKHQGDVIAYDTNQAAFDFFQDTKVLRATSLAQVAAQADIVFLSLPGGPQVGNVCFSDGGLISGDRKLEAIVDLSTTSVSDARSFGRKLAESQVRFADAPVARTREAAHRGELSVMVGASSDFFFQIEPLLHYIATDVTLCGDIGCGQVVKLVNNAMVAETTAALAEMIILGERAGVKGETLLDAVSRGSGDSFVLRNHGRKAMVPRNFPDKSFSPEYVMKDLGYVLELGREQGLELRITDLAHNYFKATAANGWSGRYFPAVIEIVDKGVDIYPTNEK